MLEQGSLNVMNQLAVSELEMIEQLRAQLRSKDEDLAMAKRHILQLQGSNLQPASDPSTSTSTSEVYTNTTHGDIQLSVVPVSQGVSSGNATIPQNAGGNLHSHYHPSPHHDVDPRFPSDPQYLDGDGAHAVKRQRTRSQQVPLSQKMDRATSNMSARSAGPFTSSLSISPNPTFQVLGPDLQAKAHENYIIDESTVPSELLDGLIQHIPVEKQPLHLQQQGMTSFAEMASIPSTTGPLLDPAVWLAANTDASIDMGFFPFPGFANQGDMDIPHINGAPSVCGSMTSGPTYDNTAPMTRQNSHQFDGTVGGVRMVNVGSQMSHEQDGYFSEFSQQNMDLGDASPFTEKRYFREDDLLAVGSSLVPFSEQHYPGASSNEGLLSASDMERSFSDASNASARSTSSSLSARAKDTLKQQNHRAMNAPLKPKPMVEEIKANIGSDEKNDGKAPISKAKYIRPRQPKVFCDLCDEHKDGFRGEHELRRHKDAKHQKLVKKFICVDPYELGLPVNVQVVNPLSKCKACKAKKNYGAYYNAAAHLRRTHFKEKPSRSKNKGSGANTSEEEKRGGKGGGDWPAMPELKNWMREVYVHQNEQQSKEEDDADDEVETTPQFFGDVEPQSTVDTNVTSTYAPVSMANVDFNFAAPLPINAETSYMGGMPPPSADFLFAHNTASNMPISFDVSNGWN
ncbi:hypothetical protein GGS20DRAFT_69090 [Poronia punctata]|nr:hypothetical protein GGS20DRAFT_69090 [Poronia punctata]